MLTGCHPVKLYMGLPRQYSPIFRLTSWDCRSLWVSVWEQVDIKVSQCFGSQFKCHRSHPNCWACPPNPFKDVALATKISEATWFGYLDQELAQKKK